MKLHSCTRCAAEVAQERLDSGEATLINEQPYCDPCSDVMFGLLDPSEAPPPIGALDREEVDFDHQLGEVELVEFDENYDTSDVEALEEVDFQEMPPVSEESDLVDTTAATVSVDVGDVESEEFESPSSFDVSLDDDMEVLEEGEEIDSSFEELDLSEPSDEEEELDLGGADKGNSEEDSSGLTQEVDFEGLDEAALESFEESEGVAEVGEDDELPDYLPEEDEGANEPVLEETVEDELRESEKVKKKESISEAKKVKPARTKKGKKAKTLTPEEKEKKKRERVAQQAKAREVAQVKKKKMKILLFSSLIVIGAAGGALWWKGQAENRPKKETQVNFETDSELIALYGQFEELFSLWKQAEENDKADKADKAKEAKIVYFKMRDHVMQWSEELEKQGQLTPKIEAYLGKNMQRYQEDYRQIRAFLSANGK